METRKFLYNKETKEVYVVYHNSDTKEYGVFKYIKELGDDGMDTISIKGIASFEEVNKDDAMMIATLGMDYIKYKQDFEKFEEIAREAINEEKS